MLVRQLAESPLAANAGTAISYAFVTISGRRRIGALFIRNPQNFAPLLFGRSAESGLRAGTQNLFGAVAFGVATESALKNLEGESERLRALTNSLLIRVRRAIPAYNSTVLPLTGCPTH